jgi:hypothetical protein
MAKTVANGDDSSQSARARRLRLLAFVAILAFELGEPAYRQVFGGTNRFVRKWIMFEGIGLGVVDARFSEALPDGRSVAVDRFATLGLNRTSSPRDVRRIVHESNLRAVGQRLCAASAPGTDLRVVARIAERSGWRLIENGERNLCR